MDMKGEYDIPAPRQAVWDALNDPEILKQAIPGCQSLERSGENGFEATVKAKVGPVSATFKGQVELSDIDPPNGYRISGEGKGGAAGFAKGGATVNLADLPDGGTKLSYVVDAQVGGKLAQIGSRLIDSTAKKMAGDFFSRFAALVAPGEATSAGEAQASTAPQSEAAAPASQPAEPAQDQAQANAEAAQADITRAAIAAVDQVQADRKGLSPMVWIVLIVLVAGVLILLNA